MSLAVGIDLGTTNSCIAIYQNGEAKIIETEALDRITPSFVYYDGYEVTVGKEAANRAAIKPENGVFDSKRLIGRKFDDREVQRNKNFSWPFTVLEGHQNEPLILITLENHELHLRPEEVSAAILKTLKQDAHRVIDEKITNAVITVPAYFNNSQRKATEDAAKIAGLNVLKLINEPSAAALAFSKQVKNIENQTVLVYDLGGGTFDVSLMKFHNGTGEVIKVNGDPSLGGRDFDNNLLKYCIDHIKEKLHYGITEQKPTVQRHAKRRLKTACEEAKIRLSTRTSTEINLDQFYSLDINIEISREKFEELNNSLFQKTIQILDDTFKECHIEKTQVDEVIVVGGSSRIPKIEQLITEFFEGKKINKSLNREEAVAVGAAYQAGLLSNHPSQHTDAFQLTEVTPLSLGIQVKDDGTGDMNVVIPRHSKIPASGKKKYKTIQDFQPQIELYIFEGENDFVQYNIPLGEIIIQGITSKKKGRVEVEVQFNVNYNGILKVTATETSKHITKDLEISLNNGRMSEKELTERSSINVLDMEQMKKTAAKKISKELHVRFKED